MGATSRGGSINSERRRNMKFTYQLVHGGSFETGGPPIHWRLGHLPLLFPNGRPFPFIPLISSSSVPHLLNDEQPPPPQSTASSASGHSGTQTSQGPFSSKWLLTGHRLGRSP
ncbi:UNVERIFIED_CONTAM: hypothetical protein Slati_4278100 [Sesamum latifolium]|uniref:Uncharacterized protein n=1 Tax=Sesamum latifolium TaxID=2727402 RepID=A0AAW2TCX5_9LAMI